MRYVEIQVAGESGHRAVISKPDAGEIRVDMCFKDGTMRRHTVNARDAQDVASMVRIMQHALDGFAGCGGDVAPYKLVMDLFAE